MGRKPERRSAGRAGPRRQQRLRFPRRRRAAVPVRVARAALQSARRPAGDAAHPAPRHGLRAVAAEAPADADRGTLFMAYCASIAEQFETVQRWVAGGNSSGVGSTQSDPLLGVPRADERRMFRWVDASRRTAARRNRRPRPLSSCSGACTCSCRALPALERLADFRRAPIAGACLRCRCALAANRPAGVSRLEDRDNGRATWKEVREQHGGVLDAPPYGRLVRHGRGCVRCTGRRRHARRCRCKASASAWRPAWASTTWAWIRPMATPRSAAWSTRRSRRSTRHRPSRARIPSPSACWAKSRTLERRLRPAPPGWPAASAGGSDELHRASGGRACEGLVRIARRCAHGGRWPAAGTAACRPAAALSGPHHRPLAHDFRCPSARARHGRRRAARPDGEEGRRAMCWRPGHCPGLARSPRVCANALAPARAAHGPDLLERSVAGLLLGFAPTVYGNFLHRDEEVDRQRAPVDAAAGHGRTDSGRRRAAGRRTRRAAAADARHDAGRAGAADGLAPACRERQARPRCAAGRAGARLRDREPGPSRPTNRLGATRCCSAATTSPRRNQAAGACTRAPDRRWAWA